MSLSITVPARLAHHCLKIFYLLAVPQVLVSDIRERSPLLNVASWTLLVLWAAALALGIVHAYAAPCSRCRRKPADRIGRLHYRAVIAVSRYAGVPLGAVGILAFFFGPMFFDGGSFGDPDVDRVEEAVHLAVAAVVALFYAAIRFDRANFPDRVRPTLVKTFVRQRLAGVVHKSHWLVVAGVVAIAGANFLPFHGVGVAVQAVASIGYLAAWYMQLQHGETLCEQCVTDFPTDAPGYAAERTHWFRAYHQSYRIVPWTVAVAVLLVWLPNFWHAVGYLPVGALLMVLAWSGRFHSTYQPWCPVCRRRGRGGDDEREPVPDPTGDHGRPLPVG